MYSMFRPFSWTSRLISELIEVVELLSLLFSVTSDLFELWRGCRMLELGIAGLVSFDGAEGF